MQKLDRVQGHHPEWKWHAVWFHLSSILEIAEMEKQISGYQGLGKRRRMQPEKESARDSFVVIDRSVSLSCKPAEVIKSHRTIHTDIKKKKEKSEHANKIRMRSSYLYCANINLFALIMHNSYVRCYHSGSWALSTRNLSILSLQFLMSLQLFPNKTFFENS